MTSATPEPATGAQRRANEPRSTRDFLQELVQLGVQLDPERTPWSPEFATLVEVARRAGQLVGTLDEAAISLPVDWHSQVTSVASWTADEVVALVEEWQAGA